MNQLFAVLLICIAAVCSAVGALFLKQSSNKISFRKMKNLMHSSFMLGVFFYGLATVIGVPAYRYAELSLLYPFIATSYIWTSLLSVRYLKERMNMWKWLGIILILAGVSFIGFGS